jgi:hypothetical protein
MFPATTDRFAEPLDGDDADAALVRPLMAGTRLERAPLRSGNYGRWTHDTCCFAFCARLPVESRYQNGSFAGVGPGCMPGCAAHLDKRVAGCLTRIGGCAGLRTPPTDTAGALRHFTAASTRWVQG